MKNVMGSFLITSDHGLIRLLAAEYISLIIYPGNSREKIYACLKIVLLY